MNYVLGLMFSEGFQKVALIKKKRPLWQENRLNGIGGEIKNGESIHQAMVREFFEETGVKTKENDWGHFSDMYGVKVIEGTAITWLVSILASVSDLSFLEEKEEVVVVDVNTISPLRNKDMIENLPSIISLAIDYLEDKKPSFVEIQYYDENSIKDSLTLE